MQRQVLGGKIHRATVTDTRVDYEGSITIDSSLLDAANILPGEKVLIANLTNGTRLESYAMPAPPGSGVVCLNGGAALHGKKGDLVIIMAFHLLTDEEIERHVPKVTYVDAKNRIVSVSGTKAL